MDVNDHLSSAAADGGKYLPEVERAVIIDVLDRIIKQKGLPLAPTPGQMDGQQEGKAGDAALAAAEQELHIMTVSHACSPAVQRFVDQIRLGIPFCLLG